MMKHGDEDGQRVRDNVMGLCSVVPVASMRSALEAQILEPVSKTAWDNIVIDSQNACRHSTACAMKLLCLRHEVQTGTSVSPKILGDWHDPKLVEVIAQDSHDRWALSQMVQGYCYGAKRSMFLKMEPLLLSFRHLDPHIQDVYRTNALAFLQLLRPAGLTVRHSNDMSRVRESSSGPGPSTLTI